MTDESQRKLTLQEQYDVVDGLRSTDGVDYGLLKSEAKAMIQQRRQGQAITSSDYPNLSRFPYFLKSVKEVSDARLNEFETVMGLMIQKLIDNQQGKTTLKAAREHLFDDVLTKKYYRPN